ncbi:MAG: hypothetical protein RIG62_17100 [Cyclobacteriaceae bacterium]
MKTKFRQYPTYAKAIILRYVINIAIIAGYRLAGMIDNGVTTPGTPNMLNVFS